MYTLEYGRTRDRVRPYVCFYSTIFRAKQSGLSDDNWQRAVPDQEH